MTPKTTQLAEYRRGWSDGASRRPWSSVVETTAYARGYENGKKAFRSAMAEERARLSLPPEPTKTEGAS